MSINCYNTILSHDFSRFCSENKDFLEKTITAERGQLNGASMAEILEKRYSLHKNLNSQQLLNDQLKSQINRLQGLANTGMVSAMIAHEMNNILTPLENYAQLAINNPDDKILVAKALEKTAKNSARAGKILRSMLNIASGELNDKAEHNLKALVDEIFDCMARDFSRA